MARERQRLLWTFCGDGGVTKWEVTGEGSISRGSQPSNSGNHLSRSSSLVRRSQLCTLFPTNKLLACAAHLHLSSHHSENHLPPPLSTIRPANLSSSSYGRCEQCAGIMKPQRYGRIKPGSSPFFPTLWMDSPSSTNLLPQQFTLGTNCSTTKIASALPSPFVSIHKPIVLAQRGRR